jgi:predicted GNAT family acetyltransferase
MAEETRTAPPRLAEGWPEIPVAAWEATRDTLHMWTQVVGKVRLALEPLVNHWWQTTFYVTSRGLTTSLMPYRGRGVEMEFDFLRHLLDIRTTDGGQRQVRLEPRSVADFYADTMARLAELDVVVEINPLPSEVPVAIRFPQDETHASYDAEYAHRFWLSLVQIKRVLTEFRSRFIGKVSPVHFFWGAFDLAVTRFSGRAAPLHPGGVPNCPDWVTQEGYSHEVSSCGYWPGGAGEGFFYAYAYPEPDGFRDWPVEPEGASYDAQLGEFLLPYELVRTAEDPDATLLSFLQTTYEAAAELAGWDRPRLERPKSGIIAAENVAAPETDIDVSDLTEEHRFEAKVDGKVAGRAEYILAGDLIVFSHTEVDPAFERRGVGAALVRHSLDEARRRGLAVMPICPFYRTWIERHPEYHDTLYRPLPSRVTD